MCCVEIFCLHRSPLVVVEGGCSGVNGVDFLPSFLGLTLLYRDNSNIMHKATRRLG